MPLNPFIRAFFRSTIPAQCLPIQDYILLVPQIDSLLHSRDRETNQLYTELCLSEEFLGSHVIRCPKEEISNGSNPAARDNRGKARQYSTSNGRTVIVKDTWVYTNKGFRNLNQAQLQNDVLYWPSSMEAQPWLIYYITRPLLGALEHIPLAIKPKKEINTLDTSSALMQMKREITSFDELLGLFPMIARQLQPGLRTLFQELELSIPGRKGSTDQTPLGASLETQNPPSQSSSNGSIPLDSSISEDGMRKTTETAIMAAVELFQRVDQSQLHLLATTTHLTGSTIEHLIERYVCEQLHDAYLFPQLLAIKKSDDLLLDQKIKDMAYIDISQVGISLTDNSTRTSIAQKVIKGVEKFEELADAKSPMEMLDVLLQTAHTLTNAGSETEVKPKPNEDSLDITENTSAVEKIDDITTNPVLTMNADMLVSLLLIVVIRAKVHGLQTCLSYMRNFTFLDDVEQGEKGYVLSTLEAVLFHITLDSEHMGKASGRNAKLWDRIRKGNVNSVRQIIESSGETLDADNGIASPIEETTDVRFAGIEDDRMKENRKPIGKQAVVPDNDFLGLKVMDSDIEGLLLSPNLDHPSAVIVPEILAKIESPGEKLPELIPELDLSETVDEADEVADSNGQMKGSTDIPFNSDVMNGHINVESANIRTQLTLDGEEEHLKDREENEAQEPYEEDEEDVETDLLLEQPIEDTNTDTETQVDVDSVALTEETTSTYTPTINELTEQAPRPKAAMKAKFNPEVMFEGSNISKPSRHMLSRSISMRSEASRNSWASSLHSLDHLSHTAASLNEDLSSIEILTKTQNFRGESIVMMAVINQQKDMLEYLLDESIYFSLSWVLEDKTNESMTLLSAAMQGETYDIVRVIMEELLKAPDTEVYAYLRITDVNGRTAGHYAFNQPNFIRYYGYLIPWTAKDKNGQTPLFALCRSYDHPSYREMVIIAIRAAEAAQMDGEKLHLDEHVDKKGNTLLHIIHDQHVLKMLLKRDADVNATNEKSLSPLMLASKYGRVDIVRTLFSDKRVDYHAKESRGLTAVELAKDDEVRNKFDDMVMFSYSPQTDGRITAVVRGIFVEDATVRLVVKSGMPSSDMKYTITTCRRLLSDFEFLAYWLSFEHPASWLPALHISRSPFQIPSKASRAVLRDIQLQLDSFLRVLLSHSTFSTHELLWEFFLMPDMHPDTMAERSKRKCEIRSEKVQEEYHPVDDTKDIEVFMTHARESIRSISIHSRSVLRRTNNLLRGAHDFSDAVVQGNKHLSSLTFMENSPHIKAIAKYAHAVCPNDSSPLGHFLDEFRSIHSSLQGMMTALERPRRIITEMNILQKDVDKHMVSLRRSDRWPLGLMDDTRAKIHQGAADSIRATKTRQEALSRELRYSQSVAAQELASFHEMHSKHVKDAMQRLVRSQVMVEKERLQALNRILRGLKKDS